MYNNDYMYAIERSDEYLAHYGVRGMKWGVRKAIASGNSARLGRQYAKAQKKLAKLEKRAANASKYGRRAALYGAGAAAAGGLALAGTGKLGNAISRIGGGPHSELARDASRPWKKSVLKTTANGPLAKYGDAISKWGQSTSISTGAGGVLKNVGDAVGRGKHGELLKNASRPWKTSVARTNVTNSNFINASGKKVASSGVTNGTIARVGAGVIGAGLAAAAAKNAYRAATAQKKAARFRSEMNKAFAGTKYSNGGNRQGKKRRR